MMDNVLQRNFIWAKERKLICLFISHSLIRRQNNDIQCQKEFRHWLIWFLVKRDSPNWSILFCQLNGEFSDWISHFKIFASQTLHNGAKFGRLPQFSLEWRANFAEQGNLLWLPRRWAQRKSPILNSSLCKHQATEERREREQVSRSAHIQYERARCKKEGIYWQTVRWRKSWL